MLFKTGLFTGSVGVFFVLLGQAVAQSCQTITPAYGQPTLASGYQAKVLLNGLKTPRSITIDTAGNLLVVEAGGSGVRRVVLQDNGGLNVCAASSQTIISDATLNHGIGLSADGKTLFVSSLDSVFSYSYDAAAGTATNKKTVINNMRNGGHSTRTILTPKSSPDYILISRGSDGNIDNGTIQASTARSVIKSFRISQITGSSTPIDYNTGGEVLGWGLRNSVGVAEDQKTGGIWSVENSADDIRRSGQDIHNTNPAEELNYHGVLSSASNAEKGANYGYPACFSAWDPSVIPSGSSITVGSQFSRIDGTPYQQVVGSTDPDTFCRTQRHAPRLVFPSHTAPLDIKFKNDSSAAYISFHGSWDRQPADGFRIGRVEFANGQPVAPVTSTTAVTYVVQNANLANCPSRCFRPVGMAIDSKNRIYFASDSSNEVWVVTTPA